MEIVCLLIDMIILDTGAFGYKIIINLMPHYHMDFEQRICRFFFILLVI